MFPVLATVQVRAHLGVKKAQPAPVVQQQPPDAGGNAGANPGNLPATLQELGPGMVSECTASETCLSSTTLGPGLEEWQRHRSERAKGTIEGDREPYGAGDDNVQPGHDGPEQTQLQATAEMLIIGLRWVMYGWVPASYFITQPITLEGCCSCASLCSSPPL
jgi:hypothetical protein